MKNTDNLPIIAFETQPDWEAWLEEHHTNTKGIWLKLAKKDAGIASVSYAEALEGAFCSGWIDGQKASFDEQYWLQKFTPRVNSSEKIPKSATPKSLQEWGNLRWHC